MDAQEGDTTSFVDKKLTEWKLAEYRQVFKENEVDEEAFLIITEEQVEKLIPLIGPRSKFMENRSTYIKQKDLNPQDGLSEELDDTLSVTSSPLTDSEPSVHPSIEAGSKKPKTPADFATVKSGERLIRLLKSCERHHHMLHYGRIMREIGPLRHVWAMRFEAKHRSSKKNSAISFSRVNICKTLAIKHQLYFANALIEDQFLNNNITFEILEDVAIESYQTIHPLPTNFHRCKVLKKLTIGNRMFKINDVILPKIEEIPVFCEIKNIYMKNGYVPSPEVSDFMFIVKLYQTVNYNEHYQAHMVKVTDTLDFVVLNSENYIKKVSVILMSDGNTYVVHD